MERSSSIIGKMNEKPWCILHGSYRTERGNKKMKKERPHFQIERVERINKKRGRFEMSKKSNRNYDLSRCC